MQLAKTLRRKIEESGLSHAEIARQTGIPQPTVTRFVNGRDIRVSTAERLAAFFGVSIAGEKGRKKK